jgi:hypothetical protein
VPVASPTPTIVTAPAAVCLSFATGTTFGIAQDTLHPSQFQTYMLEVMLDQPLIAMVDLFNRNMTFGITVKNGAVLLDASQAQTTWQGFLPSTQDYIVEVVPQSRQVVNYSMKLEVYKAGF